jgi:hypothetical protein
MTGFKWAGILTGTLTIALIALANVLVVTLTTYAVPNVVNDFGIAVAAVSTAIACSAHLYERVSRKLDLMVDLFVGRLEALEERVGDRNSGFVEGYLLGHGPDASVVPLAPPVARRGVRNG